MAIVEEAVKRKAMKRNSGLFGLAESRHSGRGNFKALEGFFFSSRSLSKHTSAWDAVSTGLREEKESNPQAYSTPGGAMEGREGVLFTMCP